MDSMKLGISKVAEIYLASRFEVRIGLIQFRDRVWARTSGDADYDPWVGDVRYPTMELGEFSTGSFTSNIDEFNTLVGSITPVGGGDEPESSFDAIAFAATKPDWGERHEKRVIVLMTDAPPVIPDDVIKDCEQLAEVITKAGIDQIFIIAPEHTHRHYAPLQLAKDRQGGFIFQSYHQIVADVDKTVDTLQIVAQTSSDSFNIDEDETEDGTGSESYSENPFVDTDEEDHELSDDGSNPFAETSEEDHELSDDEPADIPDEVTEAELELSDDSDVDDSHDDGNPFA